MNKKSQLITILCLIFSLVIGIVFNDIIIGGTVLATGLLNSYYAGEGKRINYILGLINCLVYSYVAFKNNLYGLSFFYLFIFAPLQVQGFISWGSHLNKDNSIKAREFTMKKAILVICSCITGSILLGYLLSLIPGQQLAFMDSTSNIINLCAVILMNNRFKEAWWVWLINNTIDVFIWLIIVINGTGENSIMLLIVSLGYFLLNFYGIIKWQIEAKKNKKERV